MAMRILQAPAAHPTMSIKKLIFSLLLATTPLAVIADAATDLPPPPLTIEEAQARQRQAASMRREADRLREEAERLRARDDAACHKRFFVNACRDSVRKAFITRSQVVRKLEIDANQIDRVAKTRQIEIESARKPMPAPPLPPLPANSVPLSVPAPEPAQPSDVPTPPAPQPGESSEAARGQARQEVRLRAEEAARQQKVREEEAAGRARKAREDAARYDKRAREHAEKMARKTGASAPAVKP